LFSYKFFSGANLESLYGHGISCFHKISQTVQQALM
jgi:hypothetical protein